MINLRSGGLLIRPKLMADGSIRGEFCFGENISLADFDDLIRQDLSIIVAPSDALKELTNLGNDSRSTDTESERENGE